MKLAEYLCESGVSMNFQGTSKSDIIRNLVELLTQTVSLSNPDEIIGMLEERERLKTTGIGSGIAIPHCKSTEVNKVHIVIGISKEGIDFESLDKQPAHLFFLLVAPEKGGSEHLKASAKIVRFFREEAVREQILQLTTSKEVLDYIDQNE